MKKGPYTGFLIILYVSTTVLNFIYYLEFSGLSYFLYPSKILSHTYFNNPFIDPVLFLISGFLYHFYHFDTLESSGKQGVFRIQRVLGILFFGILILFSNRLITILFIGVYPVNLIIIHILYQSLFPINIKEKSNSDIKIKTESRKMENESSFHWKTESGNINIVNPFQGILIVGGAGSGKTYSLIQEIIAQSFKKGYTGFIYDFKYPELTEFTYQCFLENPFSKLKFYTVNFLEPEKSHRINPLHPRNIPISVFANEFATVILKNLKKEWVNKQDFWADNAISYLKAIIWFLRKHEPHSCTLPHVIAMALKEYSWVLEVLGQDLECKSMISSLWTAFRENAQSQIAGCISSVQNPIDKLNSPEIFWVLTGDEAPLNLNSPENPAILTIGNNASIQESLNPIISLISSVIIKNLNQKGKLKSIFLLDEAPTLFIPNLKDLPNTGRSNRISTIYCCQDYSQMELMYGKEESRVLRASLGNQFFGMVNDIETAVQISRVFGKENEMNQSKTLSSSYSATQSAQSSTGYSYSYIQKEILKPNAALYFNTGFFVGKLTEAKKPFFAGKPIIPKRKDPKPLPEFKKLSFVENPYPKLESNLWNPQQNSFTTVIDWNYKRVFWEVDEILFRHSP